MVAFASVFDIPVPVAFVEIALRILPVSHRHHRKSLVSTSLRIFGALSCLENGALCNILQRRFAVVDLEPDLSFSRILIA